jgi:hypothetical protein
MSVCLAWSTASGFLIGDTLQLYVTMLVAAGYPQGYPLFMTSGSSDGACLDCLSPRPLRADTLSGRLQGYLKAVALLSYTSTLNSTLPIPSEGVAPQQLGSRGFQGRCWPLEIRRCGCVSCGKHLTQIACHPVYLDVALFYRFVLQLFLGGLWFLAGYCRWKFWTLNL